LPKVTKKSFFFFTLPKFTKIALLFPTLPKFTKNIVFFYIAKICLKKKRFFENWQCRKTCVFANFANVEKKEVFLVNFGGATFFSAGPWFVLC
jgi:hypothetical protein